MMKALPISNIRRYAHKKTIDLTDETLSRRNKLAEFVKSSGDVVLFIINAIKQTFSINFEFTEFLKQCYHVGNKSLGLISITGVVIGVVLTIQSRPVLVDFGAVTMLPGMVAISVIREMGPVITALICAGKVGSGIGAELGSMRVTEQIDAMEVSSTNPIRFLIVPRILATTLMIPLLTLYADILGILGSWAASNIKGDVSFTLFISQAFGDVDFMDFFPAFIKSFFFGAVIGIVGCYKGFNAGRGT